MTSADYLNEFEGRCCKWLGLFGTGGLLDLGGGCEQVESLGTLKFFISSATRPRPTRFSPPTPDSVHLEADITRKSFPERQREREGEGERGNKTTTYEVQIHEALSKSGTFPLMSS